jgi:hypothetical protein
MLHLKNKKTALNKIGVFSALAILCCIISVYGADFTKKAHSDGSAAVLSVSKGGTGNNTFANGRALIGNGDAAFSTLGIDATPSPGSTNLITNGAAYNVNQTASNGGGFNNLYKELESSNTGGDDIYIFGQVPVLAESSPQGIGLIAHFSGFRLGSDIAFPFYLSTDIIIDLSYGTSGVTNSYTKFVNFNKGVDWSDGAAGTAQLGTFTYNDVKYVGLRIAGLPDLNSPTLNGYYTGTLAANCSETVTVCVGKKIQFSSVTGWTTFATS